MVEACGGVQRSQVSEWSWQIIAAVLCCHFSVYLIFFNYTPMEVVPPVGMLVYTAVYTLAGDGHVGRSRVRNPAPRYLISRFMFSFLCATHTRYARATHVYSSVQA